MIKERKTYGLGSANVSISIRTELLLELNDLASESGLTRNRLINHAIEELLNKERRKEAKADKDFVIRDQALNAHPEH